MRHENRLCHAAITHKSSIKDLGVYLDSKLCFHSHIGFLFSGCIKLFCLIRPITFKFSFMDCFHSLYFSLVRSNLENALVVWNSVTSTDVKKLERIQQKFAPFYFCLVIPHFPYSYTLAFGKVRLDPLRQRRCNLDSLLFCSGLLSGGENCITRSFVVCTLRQV
jgi:hypothetical protein